MTYEIECYIETIDSEGGFTIQGTEGYCLEKDGETYNILWLEGKSSMSVACLLSEKKFSLPQDKSQKKFLLLVSARTSHSKVKLIFDKASDNNEFTLKKFALI